MKRLVQSILRLLSKWLSLRNQSDTVAKRKPEGKEDKDMSPLWTERLLPLECYSIKRGGELKPLPLLRVVFIVQHYFSAKYTKPEAKFDTNVCWQLFHDLNLSPDRRLFELYSGERVYASAHFLIPRDGNVTLLVPVHYQAFHAGVSEWQGYKNLNASSIGIENVGDETEPFTEEQYKSNAKVCVWLMGKFLVQGKNIVGHSDIGMPRGRKKDPGPHFDWIKLRHYISQELANGRE